MGTPKREREFMRRLVASYILFRLATALVVLLAVVAAAVAGAGTAHSQQVDDSLPPLADLTIASGYHDRYDLAWEITVKNNTVGAHPGMHVHLVKVRITLWDPVRSTSTRIWTIRDLPPGGSVAGPPGGLSLDGVDALYNEPGATDEPEWVPQRLYVEIIESDPVESPRFRFNNATENWAVENRQRGSSSGGGLAYATNGDVAIDVAGISDRSPQERGATTFTVDAYGNALTIGLRSAEENHTLFDVQVEISLSPGLSFAANQQAPSGTTFDATTGIWNIGTISSVNKLSLPVAVNLTADSLADLPLEGRCLTAKVVNAVPWFANRPLKRLNDTATACLGVEVLSSGTMDLVSFYPCIGVTSTPCTSADTLELVVDVGRIEQPESFIFHVPDPDGRTSKSGSLVWSTVNLMDLRDEQTRLTSSWSIKESVKVTAPGGGDAPGRWLLTNPDDSTANNYDLLDAMDSSTVTYDFFDLSDIGTDPTEYYIDVKVDFWALGTYKALLGIFGRLSGTTYTDSSTYTFHVGPMADLEVRDGGPNLNVPAGQRAFSIVAVNHGPDAPPAVEVKITGLKANDVQRHSASRGSFNPNSGVWTIGDLKTKDRVRAASGRDGEVLTIIPNSSSDVKEIGASITTEDYQVCIDSSRQDVEVSSESACTGTSGNTWHTTKYYDRVEGNESATISQHKGTGAALSTLQVSGLGGAAMLARWTELPSLFSRPVTHYEIERSADGGKSWTALDDEVVKTAYVDLDAKPANNPTYRVRGVNDLLYKGPWSSLLGPTGSKSPRGTAEAPGAPVNVGATADGGSAIDVRWDAPTEDGGAPVTRYEVQWSADGQSGWRRAGYVNDTQSRTYKHSGLVFGDTRYYRVRAQNSGGWGAWSDPPASATTRAGVPDAPTLRTHNSTPDTIRLRWAEPHDNGGAITSYEIESSEDGSVDSWQSLTNIAAEDVRVQDENYNEYSDTSVPSGDERYYRARAVNSMGAGTLVGRGERGHAARDTDAVPSRAQRSERHPAHLGSPGRRHGRQHGHGLRTGGVHGQHERPLDEAAEPGRH